jgi:hypothetical protein
VETNRENQQILTANSIEQNNVIESLQAQIAALTTAVTTATPPPPPAQANAATTTDANAKMMETMMAMMNKMKTSGSTGDTSGSGGGGGGKKKKYLPRDNDKDGKRTTRRYDNDNYCWTCGFDLNHISAQCKWITDETNHKKEATASNTMGGSQRNMHLRTS